MLEPLVCSIQYTEYNISQLIWENTLQGVTFEYLDWYITLIRYCANFCFQKQIYLPNSMSVRNCKVGVGREVAFRIRIIRNVNIGNKKWNWIRNVMIDKNATTRNNPISFFYEWLWLCYLHVDFTSVLMNAGWTAANTRIIIVSNSSNIFVKTECQLCCGSIECGSDFMWLHHAQMFRR